MKTGAFPFGAVDSVWLCVVRPFGSTVKKASQKVVEAFIDKCGNVDGIVVTGNVGVGYGWELCILVRPS